MEAGEGAGSAPPADLDPSGSSSSADHTTQMDRGLREGLSQPPPGLHRDPAQAPLLLVLALNHALVYVCWILGMIKSFDSYTSKQGMAEGDEDLPRDAKIVKSLLKSMGVEDYEPRVLHQFLELWYRYVVDVLTDAQVYSEHAGKAAIDCDDVKLAIQSKVNFSFSQPPPREVLLELARNRNKIPLPKTAPGPGIPLPPDQDTLLSPNYQLAIPETQPAPAEETEADEESADPNPSQEPKTDVPQHTPQRVSFPLTKRQKFGS